MLNSSRKDSIWYFLDLTEATVFGLVWSTTVMNELLQMQEKFLVFFFQNGKLKQVEIMSFLTTNLCLNSGGLLVTVHFSIFNK